jgi:nuclear pore complex protein Nup98-Nup96
MEVDSDHSSDFGEDDTFQGKQMMTIPGGYGRQSAIPATEDSIVQTIEHDSPQSEQPAYSETDMSDDDDGMDMAGSYPAPNDTDSPPRLVPGTPGKPLAGIDLDGDWAEQLQRTISPRKQNRDALRDAQNQNSRGVLPDEKKAPDFETAIDITNALFGNKNHTSRAGFKARFGHSNVLCIKRKRFGGGVCQPKPMKHLLKLVTVRQKDGIPQITYPELPFSAWGKGARASPLLFKLLHVLFDDYDDTFTDGLTTNQRAEFAGRIRSDRLSQFLRKTLSEAAVSSPTTSDPVRSALQYLAVGDTERASETLLEGKNVTLALLVAQLPNAGPLFQENIRAQIEKWREQSMLSEIELDIRAVYELLSGNTTISQGKPGPVEHKVATFSISERFSLGWLTMFAINLWYGPRKTENIEHVIEDFANKLSSRQETSSPMLNDGSEDPLWVVLRLYARFNGQNATTGADIVFPQALSALRCRGQWDDDYFDVLITHHAILNRLQPSGKQAMITIDEQREEQLTSMVAEHAESRRDVTAAMFVLLHLRNQNMRSKAARDLLGRNVGDQKSLEDYECMTNDLCIPPEWWFAAAAVAFRGRGANLELGSLLLARDVSGAHACLVERVAPALIIDEDWEGLRRALGECNAKWAPIAGNEHAAVFDDFCKVVEGGLSGGAKQAALSRACKGICALWNTVSYVGEKAGADDGTEMLQRRVALREMARRIAEEWQQGAEGAATLAEVLEMPLDAYVKRRLGMKMVPSHFAAVTMSGEV